MEGCKKKFDGYHYCGETIQGSERPIYCDECKPIRDSGYYWVKHDGDWRVELFDGERWDCGEYWYDDDLFDEIDERRMVRGE